MFVQLRCHKKSGVVLLMTTVLVTCILFISVTILTQNVYERSSKQDQIDKIRADQLAEGYFWKYYSSAMPATSGQLNTEIIDNRTFTVSVVRGTANAGPNSSTQYTLVVGY